MLQTASGQRELSWRLCRVVLPDTVTSSSQNVLLVWKSLGIISLVPRLSPQKIPSAHNFASKFTKLISRRAAPNLPPKTKLHSVSFPDQAVGLILRCGVWGCACTTQCSRSGAGKPGNEASAVGGARENARAGFINSMPTRASQVQLLQPTRVDDGRSSCK